MISRCVGLFAGCALLVCGTSHAVPECADYAAGGELRWVVPNTTGSSYDLYARGMRARLAEALGVPVRLDNVSGAGGLVGAREIAGSQPDGRTIGIVNGTGLMVSQLVGRAGVPDPTKAFTLLGRASPVRHVWLVADGSPFGSPEALARHARQNQIVFAVRSVASSSFVSLAVGAHVLGLDHVFVTGYAGNRDARLAVLRGEADIASGDLTSVGAMLASGRMRTLLSVDGGAADEAGVPALTDLASEGESSAGIAQGLVHLLGANRLFVAPAGLSQPVRICLEAAIAVTLEDPDVRSGLAGFAGPIRRADGAAALEELSIALGYLPTLAPIIRRAATDLTGLPGG